MAPLSVSDLSRNKAIKRLDFPSLLPAPIEEVWRVTTDFDFVVHLLKPWFTITYDRSNAGHELAAGWTKDTDWKLLGIIPYGRWHEEIVEWEPPYRFVDSITNTPFPFWRHTHLYERRGDSTLYTDRLDIDPGWMGPVGLGFIKMIWAPRLVKLRRHFEQNRRST